MPNPAATARGARGDGGSRAGELGRSSGGPPRQRQRKALPKNARPEVEGAETLGDRKRPYRHGLDLGVTGTGKHPHHTTQPLPAKLR